MKKRIKKKIKKLKKSINKINKVTVAHVSCNMAFLPF